MSWVERFAWLKDDIRQAKKATGITYRGEGLFKKRKESPVDYECQVRQGIDMVFKEPIYKLFALIRYKSYFKKPEYVGLHPRKHNQRWRCFFHEEKDHRTENCWALKVFLDQLVQDGHLKEFIDEEKTQEEKAEVRPNPRFN